MSGTLVTIIARSLAVMVSGERQRASQVLYGEILYIEIRSWLSIKYTNDPHIFVTYECTQLLSVSLTRFYLDSFSFKENTYPVLNQRHIFVDIRTAPFFYRSQSREIAFFKTDPSTASGLLHYCCKSHSCYRHQGKFFRWAKARAVSVWYLDLHYHQ